MIEIEDLTLLDASEVARDLGLPLVYVKELIRHERMAAVMHGGRYMVAKEEVTAFREREACAERSRAQAPGRPFLPPPRDPNQHVLWE